MGQELFARNCHASTTIRDRLSSYAVQHGTVHRRVRNIRCTLALSRTANNADPAPRSLLLVAAILAAFAAAAQTLLWFHDFSTGHTRVRHLREGRFLTGRVATTNPSGHAGLGVTYSSRSSNSSNSKQQWKRLAAVARVPRPRA